jgi:hypothetical protein
MLKKGCQYSLNAYLSSLAPPFFFGGDRAMINYRNKEGANRKTGLSSKDVSVFLLSALLLPKRPLSIVIIMLNTMLEA